MNSAPATAYFSDCFVNPSGDGYILLKHGREYFYVEQGPKEGTWRWYNNPSKDKASWVCLFVIGDPSVDVFHCNPSFTVEEVDGIFTITNSTFVNGVPYQDAEHNGKFNQMGAHWYMKGISDGNYIQGGFIASDGYSFKGSSRPDFVKITKREDVIVTDNYKEGAELLINEVDYVIKQEDIEDKDKETLVLMPILSSTKTSPFRLSVDLETIFEER